MVIDNREGYQIHFSGLLRKIGRKVVTDPHEV